MMSKQGGEQQQQQRPSPLPSLRAGVQASVQASTHAQARACTVEGGSAGSHRKRRMHHPFRSGHHQSHPSL
eukprot:scaffold34654_cov15-Tisochrysis_lutea.AAC.1